MGWLVVVAGILLVSVNLLVGLVVFVAGVAIIVNSGQESQPGSLGEALGQLGFLMGILVAILVICSIALGAVASF